MSSRISGLNPFRAVGTASPRQWAAPAWYAGIGMIAVMPALLGAGLVVAQQSDVSGSLPMSGVSGAVTQSDQGGDPPYYSRRGDLGRGTPTVNSTV